MDENETKNRKETIDRMNGEVRYTGSVVNSAVSDMKSIVNRFSSLSGNMKSATNKIVSARGFNEYVGGITSDSFSSLVTECGNVTTELSNKIRQKQIDILAYNQDQKGIDEFLDTLSNSDYANLDLSQIDQYISFGRRFGNVLKGVGSSIATAGLGLAEGVLEFGETGADLVKLGGTLFASIFTKGYDLLSGDNLTERMWEDTKADVSEKKVESIFNNLYNNTEIGQQIKDNAYLFEGVRGVGKGIGYTSSLIAANVVTGGIASGLGIGASGSIAAGQLAASAGLMGFSSGTEEAWADGATVGKGLAYGVASGAWEAAQWYTGAKINQYGGLGDRVASGIFKGAASGVGTRIAMDTVDSGLEGFVQPALTMIYKDYGGNSFAENYSKAFEAAGGWGNVATHAAIGAFTSTIGEYSGARRLLKENSSSNALDSLEKQAGEGAGDAGEIFDSKKAALAAGEAETLDALDRPLGYGENPEDLFTPTGKKMADGDAGSSYELVRKTATGTMADSSLETGSAFRSLLSESQEETLARVEQRVPGVKITSVGDELIPDSNIPVKSVVEINGTKYSLNGNLKDGAVVGATKHIHEQVQMSVTSSMELIPSQVDDYFAKHGIDTTYEEIAKRLEATPGKITGDVQNKILGAYKKEMGISGHLTQEQVDTALKQSQVYKEVVSVENVRTNLKLAGMDVGDLSQYTTEELKRLNGEAAYSVYVKGLQQYDAGKLAKDSLDTAGAMDRTGVPTWVNAGSDENEYLMEIIARKNRTPDELGDMQVHHMIHRTGAVTMEQSARQQGARNMIDSMRTSKVDYNLTEQAIRSQQGKMPSTYAEFASSSEKGTIIQGIIDNLTEGGMERQRDIGSPIYKTYAGESVDKIMKHPQMSTLVENVVKARYSGSEKEYQKELSKFAKELEKYFKAGM